MLLLPTILAPLLATAAWAQSNSTAANRTKIPFPYNGTFNTDNATFIYPKSGDYCEHTGVAVPLTIPRVLPVLEGLARHLQPSEGLGGAVGHLPPECERSELLLSMGTIQRQ